MTPNYQRILQMAVEDGVQKGVLSFQNADLEALNEDEFIVTLTNHVMTEIAEWFSWTD